MAIKLYKGDLPAGLDLGSSVAVDTETLGLVPRRDLETDIPEHPVDLCGEHGPAILRWTHEVVQ